jgi:nicotinic acid mononucleotide adenylyltransferase
MQLSEAERSRVHVLTDLHVPISATEIRRRLQADEDCSDVIPQRVMEYIRQHKLYGAK